MLVFCSANGNLRDRDSEWLWCQSSHQPSAPRCEWPRPYSFHRPWTHLTSRPNFFCVKAYHGHHHALEVLVQSLVDLDVRNSQGRTPLDLAAFKGHVECVDVLINQGASILVKDFTLKRTPIHAAATNGHSECLHLLIGNADLQSAVDIQDGNGQWVNHISLFLLLCGVNCTVG